MRHWFEVLETDLRLLSELCLLLLNYVWDVPRAVCLFVGGGGVGEDQWGSDGLLLYSDWLDASRGQRGTESLRQ